MVTNKVIFAFIEPTALVVYFVTSNLYRIGMQAYITRTLYHGEDSLGARANEAAQEARALREAEGGPGMLPQLGKRGRERTEVQRKAKPVPPAAKASSNGNGNGNGNFNGSGKGAGPTPPRPSGGNRSKKKKKRR